MRSFMVAAGALLLACGSPLGAQVRFPGKPAGSFSQFKAAEVMYVLPPVDPLEIEASITGNLGSHKKPLQFALERPVTLSPESNGSWITQEQMRIWRIHIVSPEAFSMGLVFNRFALEPGVRVFVYDPDMTDVKGAFTAGNNKPSGILPVGHVDGEEVIVEMQVPAGSDHYGQLAIESVSHAFLDLKHLSGTAACPPGQFGCSQGCEIDINCTEGDDWQLTKRSVVRVFTTTQYCSGVLLNNTAYDGTPYVMTAEHCINKPYYADRSVFLFNYESSSCFGSDGSTSQSVAAGEIMAVGDSLDFSLVKLSVVPPESYDVFYAGWDRTDFQTTGTTTIHHPWGDVKKISADFEIPSIPAQPGDVPYTDLDDYHYHSFWWIRGWDMGSTEGGSSGSPLFNASQRVIGSLSGGIARCGDSIGYDPVLDRIIYSKAFNYDDFYTRLSYAWDYKSASDASLKPWLDPLNTGASTINGYHPTGTEPSRVVEGSRFLLFPNPVSDFLQVASSAPFAGGGSYRIIDLSGSSRLSGILDHDGSASISTAPLAPGIYVIRITAGMIHENHTFIVSR